MDPNIWNVRMTMRVLSYYEVHHIFYFNLYSMNNDEEMRYLWTIPADLSKEGIHILVEFESIEQQNIPSTHDRNTTTLSEHIMVVTQIVSYELSMLYSTVNNDDDKVAGSDRDDAVSSQSESDDDNDPEKGEFHPLLNPDNSVNSVTENIVQQWESNQWFSNARYYFKLAVLTSGHDGFPYYRSVIYVDGTHLRGPYKGVLLIASTWDANNHLFPLLLQLLIRNPPRVGIDSLKTCKNT
ncbi:hypothetical protein M9H77_27311 [Catharanthus roseus]|uniref:Uncharacterized protein n=1 Tax=Catharanthus roseus TaxID=4058 RepID=A0ACC0AEW7_CATRO|nr:hypothetical protein M9H77_27311 [Catharanthus roseus]